MIPKNLKSGKHSEALLISKLLDRGYNTANPYIECCYDVIVDSHPKLRKVQIKSSTNEFKEGVFKVVTKRNDSKDTYESLRIIMAIHIKPINEWYFMPSEEVKTKTINLKPNDINCKFAQYKNNWKIFEQ